MFEIGTGVLPVAVEKEFVDPVVEIVVMRDIAPGPAGIVAVTQTAQAGTNLVNDTQPEELAELRRVARENRESVVDRASLDAYAPIHVEFAETQRGIEHH